jgi:hypothetical protein
LLRNNFTVKTLIVSGNLAGKCELFLNKPLVHCFS